MSELTKFLDHIGRFPPPPDDPLVYEEVDIPVWPDGRPKDNRIVGWTIDNNRMRTSPKVTMDIRVNDGSVVTVKLAGIRVVMNTRLTTPATDE